LWHGAQRVTGKSGVDNSSSISNFDFIATPARPLSSPIGPTPRVTGKGAGGELTENTEGFRFIFRLCPSSLQINNRKSVLDIHKSVWERLLIED